MQLERKLGLAKAAGTAAAAADQRRVAKLNREFAEDGLGDDFGEFLEGLGDASPGEEDAPSGSSDSDDEDVGSDLSDDELPPGAGEAADRAASARPVPSAEASAARQAYLPPHRRQQAPPPPGGAPPTARDDGPARPARDLYGRSAPAVVVPGSRGGTGTGALEHADVDALRPTEARTRIRRRMQGHLNRLSERNVEAVAKELEAVYAAEAQVRGVRTRVCSPRPAVARRMMSRPR